jgi:hypothetical protein
MFRGALPNIIPSFFNAEYKASGKWVKQFAGIVGKVGKVKDPDLKEEKTALLLGITEPRIFKK